MPSRALALNKEARPMMVSFCVMFPSMYERAKYLFFSNNV